MVLELPVPDLRGLLQATVRRSPGRFEDSSAGLIIDKHVRPSYDRLVDLELRVVKEDRTIATETIHDIDAGEEYRTKFKTRLKLSLQKLEAAFEGEPPPTLKIVMSIMEND